ncbi:MAG: hypothetical protein QOD86_2740 [Miltoncostaeaceae bacterium]|nr:hypothetical protein [Miltoncostaeaceae bacterium]
MVIVGQSGLALSHRAEVGRHRSEAAARRAAESERERLLARGDTVQGYRVVLEHDGQEVALDPPPRRTAPAPPNGTPREGRAEREGHDGRPVRDERAAPSVRPDVRRAAAISIPDPPPGPVPEEILARWARERPPERE